MDSPAQEAALRYLKRSPLSESQLRLRLERRAFTSDEINDAIEMTRRYGYLDDARLAENIEIDARHRGRGPRWVRQALERRGLADNLVDAAEMRSQLDAQELARTILAGRYGPIAWRDPATLQRAHRFLLGRGFGEDCAEEVVRQIHRDVENNNRT